MQVKILFLAILLLFASTVTAVGLTFEGFEPTRVWQNDSSNATALEMVLLYFEDVDNPGGG